MDQINIRVWCSTGTLVDTNRRGVYGNKLRTETMAAISNMGKLKAPIYPTEMDSSGDRTEVLGRRRLLSIRGGYGDRFDSTNEVTCDLTTEHGHDHRDLPF